MEKLTKLALGAVGFVGTSAVDPVVELVQSDTSTLVDAVIKLVIAVATVISLFKKKKV